MDCCTFNCFELGELDGSSRPFLLLSACGDEQKTIIIFQSLLFRVWVGLTIVGTCNSIVADKQENQLTLSFELLVESLAGQKLVLGRVDFLGCLPIKTTHLLFQELNQLLLKEKLLAFYRLDHINF